MWDERYGEIGGVDDVVNVVVFVGRFFDCFVERFDSWVEYFDFVRVFDFVSEEVVLIVKRFFENLKRS